MAGRAGCGRPATGGRSQHLRRTRDRIAPARRGRCADTHGCGRAERRSALTSKRRPSHRADAGRGRHGAEERRRSPYRSRRSSRAAAAQRRLEHRIPARHARRRAVGDVGGAARAPLGQAAAWRAPRRSAQRLCRRLLPSARCHRTHSRHIERSRMEFDCAILRRSAADARASAGVLGLRCRIERDAGRAAAPDLPDHRASPRRSRSGAGARRAGGGNFRTLPAKAVRDGRGQFHPLRSRAPAPARLGRPIEPNRGTSLDLGDRLRLRLWRFRAFQPRLPPPLRPAAARVSPAGGGARDCTARRRRPAAFIGDISAARCRHRSRSPRATPSPSRR